MIVSELWRYPVKSIRGESCHELTLEPRGVARDRFFAVTNADGKIGSHKTTRRFLAMPGLYGFAARITEQGTEVQGPDKKTLLVGDPALDEVMSQCVGESVRVKPETHVAHMDAGAVHIVTTAAMRWLSRQIPGSDAVIDARRFRPNLVIDCDGESLVEQQWIGKTLQIGSALLRVSEPAERCVMSTLAIDEIPNDSRVLKTLGAMNNANFGVYASVERPGLIAVDDIADLI